MREDSDNDNDDVEILLTIHPPIPKRPKSSDDNAKYEKDDDLRDCRRRLHVDTPSKETRTEIIDDEEDNLSLDDNVSLDTQEDVFLADLVAKDEVNVDTTRAQQLDPVREDESTEEEVKDMLEDLIIEEQVSHIDNELHVTSGSHRRLSFAHTESVPLSESSSDAVEQAEVSSGSRSDLYPDSEVILNGDSKKKSPVERNTNAVVDDAMTPHAKTFTYQSSAYVQNLADICYTIMNDRRWRFGNNNMKPLFSWDHGDDLSAIISLSQLYQAPPPPVRRPCTCLLCRNLKTAPATTDKEDAHASAIVVETNPHEILAGGNDDDSRALNIYCRLFYRKGPWFRINDIFTEYYAPKKSSNGTTVASDGQTQGPSQNNEVIDEDMFQEALLKMNEMISDLNRLCKQGLLRTFHDEEECGKMAGSVSLEGSGVLLSADERRSVLEKLGGSKKKTNNRREPKGERKSISPRENGIWKQMSQQQSIAAGFLSKSGQQNARHLLPVRPHVNHEVLSKLATAVVLSASCVEYIPAGILRAKLIEVKKSLSNITEQRGARALLFSKRDTCYRLREAPLLALRRCCRLHLCATSGPGDMRGDGTNGWKSIRDSLESTVSLPMARFLSQPGDNTWNTTVYPGLSSRFGLSHYGFVDAHVELPVSETSIQVDTQMEQVFSNLSSFQLWELSVEIRANVDYLVELNELILYDERRNAREAEAGEDENIVPRGRGRQSFLLGPSDQGENVTKLHLDFLNLLDKSVRRTIICRFCAFAETATGDSGKMCETVVQDVEESIASVFVLQSGDSDDEDEATGEKPFFQTDCEKVLFIVTVIITNVFKFCYQRMPAEDKVIKTRRCWLRHMWWEGVLAYVLWDCIPILEKRGMYRFASRALEVLVFGSFQPDSWRQESQVDAGWGESLERTPIGDLMISRRARGKAIERLMIDYIHILRKELKDQDAKNQEAEKQKPKLKNAKKSKSNPTSPTAADKVNGLCTRILSVAASSAFISFAAIRALARRTKRPLHQLLEVGGCKEAEELGLRLRNTLDDASGESKGYVDWTPQTDQAVAMALGGPHTTVGTRCSYVGFEDAQNDIAETRSLNVEQLAMEYYATGRLPVGDEDLAGGSWVGWHDEGVKLRALFRILCACPLLGMDGGCASKMSHGSQSEHYTVHLAKYQGAPFDLHVGSWGHVKNGETGQSVSGFYNRRKQRIEEFLANLEGLTPQDLCDCVYEAVQARVTTVAKTRNPNVVLTRDIQQVRTLCMLAAGFGGKHLAAVFRCMLFDYRHFSGGLPDLLLTRALYSDANGSKEFVDLGEWVGEAFTEEAKAQRDSENRSNLLSDKDDDFLGCSKVGDSGPSRSTSRWSRPPTPNEQKSTPTLPELPSKLVLTHKERAIKVQCLFVEVKSQNDRLDGRQEDWLNVLDRVGNARVCKFISNKKPKKTKDQPKKDTTNTKSEE